MSFLDVSEEMKEGRVTMRSCTGDLPDFYYALKLGEEIAPYFVLQGVSGDELDAVLPDGSRSPGSGAYAGEKVALMGFSWACWMAQTTMEDIFNAGPQAGLPSLSEGQRLAEGGPLSQFSREAPAAHYEYIDDFGFIGRDYPARLDPRRLRRELVMAAGFKVHKDACSSAARMIGGDFEGAWLASNQDRMWLAVLGIQETLTRKWELPDVIARIVGIMSWGFLICRGALNIFSEVHSWCMEFRGGPRREAPREVLRELAATAAVVPLIAVDLAMPWDPTVMMFDASLHGGAIIATSSTVGEQRREARCAVRGGWAAWTGISPSWVADSWCEGEAFRRVGDDVELGTRVRIPPVHECWDDVARWREAARWRWEEKERINLLEMRAGVAAARHSARSRASWWKRHLWITDSMVCLGGFSKGRSASRPILILCRRVAALDLGRGMREYCQTPNERETDEQVLPEVALNIEALADIAQLGPFQPLRIEVSVPVTALRFVHLCSGHTRAGGLEDWLLRIAALRGYLAKFDLTDKVNVRRLELLAEMETDGGHSGPSCSTWSHVRFQPGGHPPLHLRHQLRGRPGLRGDDARKVELGNAQLLNSLRILKPIALEGGSISVERPADPSCPPSPSIFITKDLTDWGAEVGWVTFPQCMWGCPALKMSTLAGTACAMQRFERPCEHSRRGASLCGKDASGRFRTRASQAYPSEFCRMLAECHVDAKLAMQERREADLTEWEFGVRCWVDEYCLFVGRVSRGLQAPSACVRRSWRCEAGRVGRTWALYCVLGLALLPFSVSTKTALSCYVPNVRRFLDFALEWNLPMMNREEIDDSDLCYLDCLVEDEVGPHRGDFVVHGLAYVWPELSSGLPRSNRALRALHRLHVAGEGGPQLLELWAVLDEAMRLAGNQEAADAAEVALDAYLRSAELFGLRAADVVIDVDPAGEQVVAPRLVVPERGERTKTGMRQGVLIDRAHVADMLVRRKAERAPADGVFACSVDAYRRALRWACDDVGVERFPPHVARHSGPSHDAATGYRTVWAIQRRGRWASEKSVLRYMKTHALVAARAALPSDVIERGARLMMKKGAYPLKARE
ncbi:unnamed protein product [Prorocentrum cordatum]|uniref:DNA-directed DNA polymerase n=1 Tax=Prorocentrum cordatum TaxID=2364126 RepID=A0ABN9WG39_9DINO|nr:unnamed protein product [Polarella glacialis]